MFYSHSILNYTTFTGEKLYYYNTPYSRKTWCASQRIKHGPRGVYNNIYVLMIRPVGTKHVYIT